MRSVTLQSIVDRARVHADMRNSGFIKDATALAMLNEVWPRLYDELVSVDENYYSTFGSLFDISESLGVDYDLPADFYKLIGVDYTSDNGNTFFTLFPFNEGERNVGFTSTNIPSGKVRLIYVPAPTTFTSLSQTIDGVAGWDRLLSLLLAIDMLDAEESNTDRLYRKYESELKRIQQGAERDMGMPGTVTDIHRPSFDAQYSWVRYRLYGNKINFMSTQYISPAIFG